MKKLLSTILILLSISQFSLAQSTKTVNANIIELSAHKVDRLVTLKKIDASFLTKVETIEISLIQNQPPYMYRSLVTQTKPLKGNPLQLEILFNKDGNALTYKVLPDGVSGTDANWPEKNAVTLVESSMHYVLENSTDTAINPFFTDASSITLTKGILAGQSVAQGQIKSYITEDILNIYVKLDGTFISYEVILALPVTP